MLTQQKKAERKLKVSVRAGFGSIISNQFSLDDITSLSASELAKRVVSGNISSTDMRTKSTARTLEGILSDPTSDLAMRLRTRQSAQPLQTDNAEQQTVQTILEDKNLDLTDLEEMELSASRLAKGGY